MMETKACWVSFLLFSLYFQLLCTFISLSTLKSRTVWANPQSSLPGRTRMKPSSNLEGVLRGEWIKYGSLSVKQCSGLS